MPLLILFVFGAILLGAGVMLSPAWNTRQPRIGLAGAMALALIVGGSVFWAKLFGWNVLVVDYIFFALLVLIFLGGTLSYGQKRAEARGEVLEDAEQGWTGPQDLLFFLFVALLFAVPVFVLPVPLDTDAQGFGYLALMAKLGGNFNTLAPFHPEVSYLYSPGWLALTAYFSERLGMGLHTVQFALGAVLGLLAVWLAYDLGAELRDKRLGRAMGLAMLAGLGLFSAYMDAHFTTLLALVFVLAFVTYAYRWLAQHEWLDFVGAGLMLGATAISHPDTTIILGLGFVPWLLSMWLGNPRPTRRTWALLAVGVPLLALVAILPWLINTLPLMGTNIASPFTRDAAYLRNMLLPPFQNPLLLPFVALGVWVGLRRRDTLALLSLGWLLLVLDFAVLGLTETLLGGLLAALFRYDYPFSIAWHGVIIPYTILGGIGLLWVYEQWVQPRLPGWRPRYTYALLLGLSVLVLAGGLFSSSLLSLSKSLGVSFFGAFSSHADVRAMDWLRQNTPPQARLLNFPGPQEGDWVPVIAERDAVYYRPQPFFSGDQESLNEQLRLRAFWRDPANPANADLLLEANISYVIVPQIVGNRDSFATAWRWNTPFAWELEMRSSVADAAYLELVYEDEGAQVYRFGLVADALDTANE